MTMFESSSMSTAWDEESARDWAERNRHRTMDRLSYPWKLAAAISSLDNEVTRVLDVASGPGGFLGAVLGYLPEASGVWFDFSTAMEEAARENLQQFAGRVTYQTGDMTELDRVGEPGSFNLVTTSRATHHLLLPDLVKFYSSALDRLGSGGWVANIDAVALPEDWDARLRSARSRMEAPKERNDASHAHPNPFPSLDDHRAAIRVAGFREPHVAWSSLVSVLVMAQKP